MKALVILCFAIIIIVPSCKKDKNSANLKAYYEINVNQSFQVSLVSNMSTGYSWKWTNKPSVSIVDSTDWNYILDNNQAGSNGKEIWKFQGIRSGENAIILEYCRPWEQNSTISSMEIIIRVR